MGENTLLVDGNLHAPHVGVALGPGYYVDTVHDVLADRIPHTKAVHLHESGLKIVPGAIGARPREYDTKRFHKYKHAADTVLFDAPPGDYSHVLDACDQAIVVTTPHYPSILEARRALQEVQNRKKLLVGVILNRDKAPHTILKERVEELLESPVIATLPHDKRFDDALARRVAHYHAYPDAKASRELREFASRLSVRPLNQG